MTARVRGRLLTLAPLVLMAGLYAFLATRIGVGVESGGPDETARLLVPKAMLSGDLLPSGYNPVTVMNWSEYPYSGNYSYAFYPQLLGAYVTALFMFVARVLGAAPAWQLVAARLSSAAWGVVGAYFVGRTVRACYDREDDGYVYGALASVLVGFWPQYAFLSAYVNNDVVGTAGVAMLVCALVLGIRQGWTPRRCALLAAGIVVCALGYLSTYGFILAAIVVFIHSSLVQPGRSKAEAWRSVGLTALACAVCTLPFFAVNVVRYGDVIGSRVFEEQHLAWVAQGNEPLMRPYDGSFWSLMLLDPFVSTTLRSFVGVFGYMYTAAPDVVRCWYWLALLLGSGAFLGATRCRKSCRDPRWRVLVIALLGAVAITVALHVWRTLNADYQAQGRYVIAILIPWCAVSALGIARILGGNRLALGLFVVAYAAICVGTFLYITWHFSWPGIFVGSEEFLAMVIP